ncbi:hypothetical protein TOPH_05320 [Tolypocladium ophioglossoides CBS 100239]|uniref:Uncharacterized protein n=1 Tax=Tolypocladium ophioglossoides (strain CBS 100239) TaxID=1163406 RepID=A0A0L0N777_TOLOC|nr:hypothetical protein TOPH_05320 [Tolypocladium ophioglossoides CBS 100239]
MTSNPSALGVDRTTATAVGTMYASRDPQARRTTPEERKHPQDAVGAVRRQSLHHGQRGKGGSLKSAEQRRPERPACQARSTRTRLAPRRSNGSSKGRSQTGRKLLEKNRQGAARWTHALSVRCIEEAGIRRPRLAPHWNGESQQPPALDRGSEIGHVRLWTKSRNDGIFYIPVYEVGCTAGRHAGSILPDCTRAVR